MEAIPRGTDQMAAVRSRPVARALLRAQPDDRLVGLARDGRELAFEEIVRRYRPGLVAFASGYSGAAAEDVVQESLVSSWNALQGSNAEINLKPWLYTIVRNRALNARRDSKHHEQLDETIDGVRQPSEYVITGEELAGVVAAVNALPDAQRQALVRSALDGHTHDQIAEALGTSAGSVRQLIFRARGTLRESFGALIPLPLLAALAGASGPAAVGGAAAGAGGASVAAKAATVAVVGAVAIGGGIAIKRSTQERADGAQPTADAAEPSERERSGSEIGTTASATAGSAGEAERERHRAADGREDKDGAGNDGRESGGSDDGGGAGGGSPGAPTPEDDGERAEEARASGGGDHDDDDGDSGHGGSGGHGSDDDDPPEAPEPEDDHSDDHSGSGSSGSGGSGDDEIDDPDEDSGSSGPGSDDEPDDPDD